MKTRIIKFVAAFALGLFSFISIVFCMVAAAHVGEHQIVDNPSLFFFAILAVFAAMNAGALVAND